MSEYILLPLAFCGGIVLGLIFFGGLWWTVKRGMGSPHPALWFFGSLILRVVLVMAGFYLITGGDWKRAVTCAVGFVAVRVALVRHALGEDEKTVNRMGS